MIIRLPTIGIGPGCVFKHSGSFYKSSEYSLESDYSNNPSNQIRPNFPNQDSVYSPITAQPEPGTTTSVFQPRVSSEISVPLRDMSKRSIESLQNKYSSPSTEQCKKQWYCDPETETCAEKFPKDTKIDDIGYEDEITCLENCKGSPSSQEYVAYRYDTSTKQWLIN